MTEPAVNRVGQRFGPYEITRFLGRGGYADVFLGKNVNLPKQEVAIKVLDKIMIQLDKAQQFKNEAQIILSMQHPSIIRFYTYDVYNPAGFTTSYPYIVMEYAPKGSLRTNHPRGKPLPFKTILSYVQQIAAALQYAHGNQVMHLDVKPENILINDQGNLLLSDFGLATLTTDYNKSGDIQGTLSYMAPEQLNGRPDKASDQYSLGVMVYEWICGSVPFTGRSIPEYVRKVLNDPPPSLVARVPTLSPTIEAVVMKALSKNLRDRYPSILQFAEQLEKAIKQPKQVAIEALKAPGNIAGVPLPMPAPHNKQAEVIVLPAPRLQLPSPAPADAAKQGGAAPVPKIPSPLPAPAVVPPIKQQAASQEDILLSPPASAAEPSFKQAAEPEISLPPPIPASNLAARAVPVSPPSNQATANSAIPDPVNADGAAGDQVGVAPGPQHQSPFLAGMPPGTPRQVQQAPAEPDPFAQQWTPGSVSFGAQGGLSPASVQSPFLDGKPTVDQARVLPNQQAFAGGTVSASPMLSPSPFIGASSPFDQQQTSLDDVTFGARPGYTYSATIGYNQMNQMNLMQQSGPPSIPPYLGRPGSRNGIDSSEPSSFQDMFSQTIHDVFKPERRRRSSLLFPAGIIANILGSIFIGVWLGRTAPSYANELAWWGMILSLVFSVAAFWLFDYSGNRLLKIALSVILAIFWGFVGNTFATLIGAGTNIGILPDGSIMSVLFLLGSFGLFIWMTFKRA